MFTHIILGDSCFVSMNIISYSHDPCFCQLRYQFEVSNRLGSVKGCVALVVHEGEGEDGAILEQDFESNPLTEEEFGEYVASLHSCNNSTFVLQYEVTQYCAIIQITH